MVASGPRDTLKQSKDAVKFWYYKNFKGGRTLTFQGRTYPYVYEPYNLSVQNERAVEIPIAWEMVSQYQPEQVLEIGNVFAHYFPITHRVLDKYEVAPGVINEDVVGYAPGRTFDLVVAVSTLEHVGWDESPRDPPKFRRALEHVVSLVAPGGTLLVTLPIGYNTEVDALLGERTFPFTCLGFLKRVTRDNIWREVEWSEVAGERYDASVPTATAIAVGTLVHA